MKQEIKIKDSGVWVIIGVLLFISLTLSEIANSLQSCVIK